MPAVSIMKRMLTKANSRSVAPFSPLMPRTRGKGVMIFTSFNQRYPLDRRATAQCCVVALDLDIRAALHRQRPADDEGVLGVEGRCAVDLHLLRGEVQRA